MKYIYKPDNRKKKAGKWERKKKKEWKYYFFPFITGKSPEKLDERGQKENSMIDFFSLVLNE